MGKQKFASGLLSQQAPPSFGSGKGVGGCARGLGILLSLFMGCSVPAPHPTAQPHPPPVPLPPLPSIVHTSGRAHPALSMTGGVSVVVQAQGYVSFQYPTNACTQLWQLQGSPDLLNWVDIGDPYAVGCPSGDLEVQSTNQVYFYRIKGVNQ